MNNNRKFTFNFKYSYLYVSASSREVVNIVKRKKTTTDEEPVIISERILWMIDNTSVHLSQPAAVMLSDFLEAIEFATSLHQHYYNLVQSWHY